VSLHADPATDYPFYWGHADEIGEDAGTGYNLNLPMARGTGWPNYKKALLQGFEKISNFDPDYLIISYGVDTFIDDPISFFKLRENNYTEMAALIKALNLPTLICMEGGYDLASIGQNVRAFLDGFN